MSRVAILTIAYTGDVSHEYALGLRETSLALSKVGIECVPIIVHGNALLHLSRNEAVAQAFKIEADAMIFVDHDIAFTANDVVRILSHRTHVVGAAVAKKCEGEDYSVRAFDTFENGLMEAEGIATGFLKCSHESLAVAWAKSPSYVDDDGQTRRMLFDVPVQENRIVSEDFALCRKLRESGYRVWIDPEINVGHVGRKVWRSDFGSYLESKGLCRKQTPEP